MTSEEMRVYVNGWNAALAEVQLMLAARYTLGLDVGDETLLEAINQVREMRKGAEPKP